ITTLRKSGAKTALSASNWRRGKPRLYPQLFCELFRKLCSGSAGATGLDVWVVADPELLWLEADAELRSGQPRAAFPTRMGTGVRPHADCESAGHTMP